MPSLCRDCFRETPAAPCVACGSRRVVSHPDLFRLAIAHIDCDAFYASVEKRDRPELAGVPVIVGGGVRGVVTTACYIARLYGVHSAQPMFKARKLCPDAVVIRPDFAKYSAAARQVRAVMAELTPLLQPLSIDEAVMDLSGTEALHGAPPASVLARFARRVEEEVGVTVSIGLAANRLLAKIAAGRDKPRGFAVLGQRRRRGARPEPVGLLPGVGPVQERKLRALGITQIAQLQAMDDREARAAAGGGRAEPRPPCPRRGRARDRARPGEQDPSPPRPRSTPTSPTAMRSSANCGGCAEKLARRLREKELAARRGGAEAEDVGLRPPDAQPAPADARRNCRTCCSTPARALLAREADGTGFRLIGIGANPLVAGG